MGALLSKHDVLFSPSCSHFCQEYTSKHKWNPTVVLKQGTASPRLVFFFLYVPMSPASMLTSTSQYYVWSVKTKWRKHSHNCAPWHSRTLSKHCTLKISALSYRGCCKSKSTNIYLYLSRYSWYGAPQVLKYVSTGAILYKAPPVLWNCVIYLQTLAPYLPSHVSLDRLLWHSHTYTYRSK